MATLSETYKVILGVGGVTGTTRTNGSNTETFLLPLPGTPTSDHYYEGLGGNDIITGQLADDYIEGGAEADVLLDVGLGVNDTLGYLNSPVGTNNFGVSVTLNPLGGIQRASGGHAQGDTAVSGFENLVGSEFNDVLTGNAGANKILGMGGDDDIFGGGGMTCCMAVTVSTTFAVVRATIRFMARPATTSFSGTTATIHSISARATTRWTEERGKIR
ncbi:Ca2+-binding RTX toxin-like protein [Phyllobacterium trifolii]|jgi:Ca2+-binding RTX toxin-like protein|uniref:Ca2+-binding RTX toxin-like protein n=1 Tax=Phyllobacterium trifolii TaxID=300193 RepID=A0A839UDF2_9HYPH|nr:hypothetical protein [Phyllobacterium trifolii]MBB3147853.1 Ca2+-binding RTX toxin-like protein [Phyllobacterium trifolii]